MAEAQILPVPDLSDIEPSTLVSGNTSPDSPLCQSTDECGFPLMAPGRLAQLMDDYASEGYDNLVILDARYEYEYRGGWIIGAKNIRSCAQLLGVYHTYIGTKTIIVFYCEFSHVRSPYLIKQFRAFDRSKHQYPEVAYPDLYLLEGGYKRFYAEYPQYCKGGYTTMCDKEYILNGELKRAHSAFKREIESLSTSISFQGRPRRSSIAESFHSLNARKAMDLEMMSFTMSASQGN